MTLFGGACEENLEPGKADRREGSMALCCCERCCIEAPDVAALSDGFVGVGAIVLRAMEPASKELGFVDVAVTVDAKNGDFTKTDCETRDLSNLWSEPMARPRSADADTKSPEGLTVDSKRGSLGTNVDCPVSV